jgi:uncharacterized protein (TIGR00725 family)
VGRLLAERGAYVICSGYTGVAVAVAAGVRSAGGTCIGILWHEREGASPDYSVVLPTGIAEASNVLVVRGADALIAVGCSWGTLSEIALGARRGDIPVITLGGWQVLDQEGKLLPEVQHADTPLAAVDLAFTARKSGADRQEA